MKTIPFVGGLVSLKGTKRGMLEARTIEVRLAILLTCSLFHLLDILTLDNGLLTLSSGLRLCWEGEGRTRRGRLEG